jgi:hypothetical protein
MKINPKFAIFAFNSDTPNGGCGDLQDTSVSLQRALEIGKNAISKQNENKSLNEMFDIAQILCLTSGKIVVHINRYSNDTIINQQILNFFTSS